MNLKVGGLSMRTIAMTDKEKAIKELMKCRFKKEDAETMVESTLALANASGLYGLNVSGRGDE